MGAHWLVHHPALSGNPRLALVAFPHAGGAPSSLRGLASRLREDVELWVASMPGRERRFTEAPLNGLAPMVTALAREIAERVSIPFALLGNSMGGLVAFEVARELRRCGWPEPFKLITVVSRAPDAPPVSSPRHLFSDEDLLHWLDSLGNMPADLLADREFVAQMLPVARADLQALETYSHHWESPLAIPITAFAGAGDPIVPEYEVAQWKTHTTAEFAMDVLPGAHFPGQFEDAYSQRIGEELQPGADWSVGAPTEVSPEVLASVKEIWREALDHSDLNENSDFFALGGRSLIATTAVARCANRFGVPVPVALLFDYPTLREFAAQLEGLLATSAVQADVAQVLAPKRNGGLEALLDDFELEQSATVAGAGER